MRGMRWLAAVGLAAALSGVLPSAPASADGALVINDLGCGMLDGNGGFAFADSSHAVVTPSANGMLKCKADVTPPAGGRAVQFDNENTGLLCGTPAGTTADWRETVSASGQAILTCKVH